MSFFLISVDQARPDVMELASTHRAWAGEHSPPEDVHAVEAEALTDPKMTLVTARTTEGELLGMGALRALDGEHVEVKSMHVRSSARGKGVGGALLTELVKMAQQRGYRRVSLETGTMEAFVSARSLYSSRGFAVCDPFGDYTASPSSVFMTLQLD